MKPDPERLRPALWKRLGALAIAFVGGLLVATLVYRDARPDSPRSPPKAAPAAQVAKPAAPIASVATSDVADAEHERQIADLKGQIGVARAQITKAVGIMEEVQTTGEVISKQQERTRTSAGKTQECENLKLQTAGFTMERIEWLRKRTGEILAADRRTQDLQRQQGTFTPAASEYPPFNADIGLRKEIGDDEYTKYRQALGRPIGVQVGKLSTGSIAETAGLKRGDQITAYNGTRVFANTELTQLIQKYATSGTPLSIEVQRNGETIRLNAAGGDLGIGPVSFSAMPGNVRDGAQDVTKLRQQGMSGEQIICMTSVSFPSQY